MEKRYENPIINRQFWLSDALIRIKSYKWSNVDKVALSLSNEDVDAVCRVVTALNETLING